MGTENDGIKTDTKPKTGFEDASDSTLKPTTPQKPEGHKVPLKHWESFHTPPDVG